MEHEMVTNRLWVLEMSVVLACLAGCGGSTDPINCEQGHCDVPDTEVPASPCDGLITDLSGANHQRVAGRNQDALSRLAFQTGDCPTSMPAMMAKLRLTDHDRCAFGDAGPERAGIMTRFIS